MAKIPSAIGCAIVAAIVSSCLLLAISISGAVLYCTAVEPSPPLSSIATRANEVDFLSYEPRILVHRNFLSSSECDHVVKLAADEVTRSGVTGEGGKVLFNDYRTSYGSFITKHMNDSVIVALTERIEKWTLLPRSYGETYYILRYDPGQQYKPHTDWFVSGPEGLGFLGPAGNRLATVIVYLSDVEEGGETLFPNIGLKIRPQKGSALLFWNRTPDGVLDPLVLHSSVPVVRGRKWSITRWIRERSMVST